MCTHPFVAERPRSRHTKEAHSLLLGIPDRLAPEMVSAITTVRQALTKGQNPTDQHGHVPARLTFALIALDHDTLTVTLNQIYAQVVPHVSLRSPYHFVYSCTQSHRAPHIRFHIVPAPDFRTGSSSHPSVYPSRQDLDDEDAERLVIDIKARL